jgi:hypothetical protein
MYYRDSICELANEIAAAYYEEQDKDYEGWCNLEESEKSMFMQLAQSGFWARELDQADNARDTLNLDV